MAKKILFSFEVKPGMVIAEDLYNPAGQLVLPAGFVLDEPTISKLEYYTILEVPIDDSPAPAAKPAAPVKAAAPSNDSYSDKIKKSEDFKHFKAEYEASIGNLTSVVTKSIASGQPIDTNSIYADTAELINSSKNTIHIFDIIHNLRNYDDITSTHSLNVALISNILGKWLGITGDDLKVLTVAALLHDIGKFTIPTEILNKPGRLSDEEYQLMKEHVKKTMRPEVLGGLGGFSGAFSLAKIKEMEEPVLLSGTDGCGTKVKLAMIMDKHDTIGIDAVAMCVNDIACAGGEPLFFLDYIACGKNYPEKIASIVKGVAEGCLQSEAALIGGETAEHPGLMPEDEYDLAGFTVGVVDKKDIITGEDVKAGDVLIGMASTGVHSNGFSLVRKIFKMDKETLNTYHEELGTTLGEALLAPTRIYVKALKAVKDAGVTVKACSHITGGGFYENIPRMLIDGKRAVVEKNSYPVPPIFKMMAREGNVEEQMMYNTYNMGLGMIVAVDPADVDKTMEAMKSAGDTPYVVGKIIDGEKGVDLV